MFEIELFICIKMDLASTVVDVPSNQTKHFGANAQDKGMNPFSPSLAMGK